MASAQAIEGMAEFVAPGRVYKSEQTQLVEGLSIREVRDSLQSFGATRRTQVKNRSILYFLAVGVLSAAPAFADRIPDTAMEQGRNSVSIYQLPYGNSLQHADSNWNLRIGDVGASNKVTFVSRLSNFDDDDKVSIMNELSSSKSGKTDNERRFIELGLKLGDSLGNGSDRDRGKYKLVKLEGGGPSLTVTAVPEPDSFTLVLFGLGVLAMLLYRRN